MKFDFPNTLRAAAAIVLAAGPLCGQTLPDGTHPPSGYKLVWSDEFNGTSLDTSKWMYRTDVKASSSQRPGNVSVHDGKLMIALQKESDRGKSYTGGGIISKQHFRYGYYEARAKMHGGAGWHQSVWAMAVTDGSTTYPEVIRTEIDGPEFDSDTAWKAHTGLIIWNGPKQSKTKTCTPGVYQGALGFDATKDFHTYGFEWAEKGVRFYFDGDLRCGLEYLPTEGEHDAINLWLTAIGYEQRGVKIDDSKLPGTMLIDFAAVYQKEGQQ
jgi:beta-glucanase (GH16 family)